MLKNESLASGRLFRGLGRLQDESFNGIAMHNKSIFKTAVYKI